MALAERSSPSRIDGYAPIRDYAAIGDGRTVALVARDAAIDWLCLPDIDSPASFAALVDARRGGAFRLSPRGEFAAERRYLPETNLLETTFRTSTGTVRLTDCMTLPLGGLAPTRELARRAECLEGRMAMCWEAEPRFDFARRPGRLGWRGPVPTAADGSLALAFSSWGAGQPQVERGRIRADFTLEAGSRALVALSVADGGPLVFPTRQQVEGRMEATERYWRQWAAARRYDGPWREAVLRSALALKLLIFAPSGAIAAAATSSLPETPRGGRNWDYRFSWIRDAAATLDALLALGCAPEAKAFFWWLMHASQLTHPELRVLYRVLGGPPPGEEELDLGGYRGAHPVRTGNGAAEQEQLDIYGHLMQTAWIYAEAGGRFDAHTAKRLAGIADLVCRRWRRADSGIWEVRSEPRQFTESKMMAWIALDRGRRLAEAGRIPAKASWRWAREAAEIESFIAERCWSEPLRSYVRAAELQELDASLLLAGICGYGGEREAPRMRQTVEAIRGDLGAGPLLYRYRGEDGLEQDEGAFLACSFWLVDALARFGDRDAAVELMDELIGRANDVGLYSEEIDPKSGEFLGNFPQALVHLGLINAAVTLADQGQ